MLTQLETVKARLNIPDTEVTQDDLLTFAIEATSARFDHETNRTLARTENATFEFDADDSEISVPCYPIESISKFETKTSESSGWSEVINVDHLIRKSCIISIAVPVTSSLSSIFYPLFSPLCRLTYTGGYVLPGTDPSPGQTPLPPDLEQAAVEQVAAWFLRRDMIGLDVSWPKGGIMQRFSKLDLLLPVARVLETYKRWAL
jgi:hypothetical protein